MSDSIGSSLAISPIGLPGLAGITPVAFQLLTTGTTTAVSSTFDSASSLVELSGVGQLLSAVSAFRSKLETLQNGSSDTSQAGISATAQNFVDAFNGLRDNIGSLQTLFQALPGTSLVDQLSLSLNEAATKTIASGSSSIDSLGRIGITLQTSASPDTATSTTLQIDQNRLNTAVAADPAGTRALLDQVTQSFLELAAGFEAQATGASISLSNLTQPGSTTGQQIDLSTVLGLNTNSTVQGIGVPTNALQNLSADTVLNDIQLTDLDLAAVGLNAGSISSQTTVRRDSLSPTLLSPSSTTTETLLSTTENLLAATPAVAATPLLPTTPTPTVTAAAETPAVTVPAAPAVNAAAVPTPAVATTAPGTIVANAVAADRSASDATLALQNLLADPRLRAINNNLFDPAYAALIAASHLNDFVSPAPGSNPRTVPSDLPEPVLPAARARAIGYYTEAAGGETLKR